MPFKAIENFKGEWMMLFRRHRIIHGKYCGKNARRDPSKWVSDKVRIVARRCCDGSEKAHANIERILKIPALSFSKAVKIKSKRLTFRFRPHIEEEFAMLIRALEPLKEFHIVRVHGGVEIWR